MKTSLIIFVLLVLGVGSYGLISKETNDAVPAPTDQTPSDEGRIRAPEDGTLSIGQTAVLAGVSTTLNDVSDSRCPQGVDCVWAGQATAFATLGLNGETAAVELLLGADPVEFAGYLVSVTSILPYPKYDVVTKKTDYRVTFHVASVVGSNGDIPANI